MDHQVEVLHQVRQEEPLLEETTAEIEMLLNLMVEVEALAEKEVQIETELLLHELLLHQKDQQIFMAPEMELLHILT